MADFHPVSFPCHFLAMTTAEIIKLDILYFINWYIASSTTKHLVYREVILKR